MRKPTLEELRYARAFNIPIEVVMNASDTIDAHCVEFGKRIAEQVFGR